MMPSSRPPSPTRHIFSGFLNNLCLFKHNFFTLNNFLNIIFNDNLFPLNDKVIIIIQSTLVDCTLVK